MAVVLVAEKKRDCSECEAEETGNIPFLHVFLLPPNRHLSVTHNNIRDDQNWSRLQSSTLLCIRGVWIHIGSYNA